MITAMKYIQSMFMLIALVFCIGTIATSCMDSDKKVENTHSTVLAAKEKFEEDTVAFQEEIKEYKIYLYETYEKNKVKIEKLRDNKKRMLEVAYKEKVEELEIANEIIKNKIEMTQVRSNLEWKNLKRELGQDIENLEESFKEISAKI